MTFNQPLSKNNNGATKILGRFAITLAIAAVGVMNASAATIYGGFEDTVNGDYDYNDLVFSLSAPSLVLNSSGTYYAKPAVLTASGSIGQNGTPFWNNSSFDGASYNVGYCIYGGGNCNGGTALDPTASYLATSSSSKTGSANDVTFSVNPGASVPTTVYITITADHDVLGWYNVSNPSAITYFDANGPVTGTFSFTPTGSFGLASNTNNGSGGQTFYSNVASGGTQDDVSHFAFFANPVPEPGTMAMLGSALLGLGFVRRRKGAKA